MEIKSTIRDIVHLGHPLLRAQAEPVTDFDASWIRQITTDMLATLMDSNGVGIAAPQIGESFRIIIIASEPNARYPLAPRMEPVIMINPVYQISDPHQDKDWEGCLSIPGIRAMVPRYRAVLVTYQDQTGRNNTLLLNDFVARVFQHELDHLQGLVYLDRVEDSHDIIAESEYFKLF